MRRCLWIVIWFALICTALWAANTLDMHGKRAMHNALTEGCVMVGTIQGYHTGRDDMPAQEQWNCNGLMRTVNVIR